MGRDGINSFRDRNGLNTRAFSSLPNRRPQFKRYAMASMPFTFATNPQYTGIKDAKCSPLSSNPMHTNIGQNHVRSISNSINYTRTPKLCRQCSAMRATLERSAMLHVTLSSHSVRGPPSIIVRFIRRWPTRQTSPHRPEHFR